MSKTLVLKPRMSEKAYATSQSLNRYVFDVPTSANKATVIKAVSQQFEVSVTEVNLLVAKGKVKRSYKKGSRPTTGKRSDFKKAYVTLKKGDSIPIFAAVEEEEKAAQKAEEKASKKAKKAEKK